MKVRIPGVKKSMSATQSKLACGNLSEFPNPRVQQPFPAMCTTKFKTTVEFSTENDLFV